MVPNFRNIHKNDMILWVVTYGVLQPVIVPMKMQGNVPEQIGGTYKDACRSRPVRECICLMQGETIPKRKKLCCVN